MINLEFSTAISLYLAAVLAAVFALWVLARREKYKEPFLEEKYLWFCSVCTYTYVSTTEESISVCPRCASFNKK
ncbi:MAG: hypothetical protein PHT59_03950 [Candidatus Omnitrophica bacterium]|nr:hypothetical protein [Candidatus Omnitrophota bacterium]